MTAIINGDLSIEGIIGGVIATVMGLVMLLACLGLGIDAWPSRQVDRSPHDALCGYGKSVLSYVGALFCALLLVAGAWGLFDTETVEFRAGEINVRILASGEVYLEDARGRKWDASLELEDQLMDMDPNTPVRCRATNPMMFSGRLISCRAAPPR
ncbi:MAG: hypothetical protein ABR606_14020 [Vicinamibacterales bacterium]